RRRQERLRADPRLVPRQGRRSRGEAPRGRAARRAAFGRVRHGHARRSRRDRDDGMSALQASTGPGEQLVALAEDLAVELGSRAAEHDREASFPFEGFAAVRERGCFAAPIPEELGGLGVTSVRDLLVASTRLARGDPSLTLGVNMHFVYLTNLVRAWRRLLVARDPAQADG